MSSKQDEIIDYMKRNGESSTWMIAIYIGESTVKTRAIMRKMMDSGLVKKSKYTMSNNIVWDLV